MGLTPRALFSLTQSKWLEFLAEIEAFHSLERRRLFQLAYERHYRVRALDALHLHAAQQPTLPKSPSFSTHHLHRRSGRVASTACGRGRPIGSDLWGGRFLLGSYVLPWCIRRSLHSVVPDRDETTTLRGGNFSGLVGSIGSKEGGSEKTLGASFPSSPPWKPWAHQWLLGRCAWFCRVSSNGSPSPLSTAHIQIARGGEPSRSSPRDDSIADRAEEEKPGPENGHRGYSIDEMVAMAKRLLEDIGLTKGFCHLVIILGHGSSSLNNPHESAYNCGACGGGRGGPNARALAISATMHAFERGLRSLACKSHRRHFSSADTTIPAMIRSFCMISSDHLPPIVLPSIKRSTCSNRRGNGMLMNDVDDLSQHPFLKPLCKRCVTSRQDLRTWLKLVPSTTTPPMQCALSEDVVAPVASSWIAGVF